MNWRVIWFDPKSGRLRSGWRVFAFLGMAMAFFVFLMQVFGLLLPKELNPAQSSNKDIGLLIQELATIPAALAAGVWALRTFDHLPSKTLGVMPEGRWLKQLCAGLLAGLGLIALGILALWAGGGAHIQWHGLQSPVLLVMGVSAAFLLIVGVAEETVFRGYMFQTLLRGAGPLPAIALTSLLFAFVHMANPDWSLLALTNIFLAGVLFCMLYLRTGSLWMPIGLHTGWNLAQLLFNTPISGNSIGYPTPFTTTFTAHRLISGGDFGLEGGLVVSILLLTAIAVATYTRKGLSLESRWWEWPGFTLTSDTPQNWDFAIGSRHYQWKLLGHDQSTE